MTRELDISDVTRIAKDAALAESLPLEVVGAVLGGPGSDYVEILVNIDDCASDPCQFAIGVFRNSSEAVLLGEISARLRRHLENHARARERKTGLGTPERRKSLR